MSAATLNAGSVGVNGRLLGRGATVLRVRGEGGLAQLDVAGDMGTLGAVAVDMRRLRLAAEASHEHLFSFGRRLTRGPRWACATTAATGRPAPAWRSARGCGTGTCRRADHADHGGLRPPVGGARGRGAGIGLRRGPAGGSGGVRPRPVHERNPGLGCDDQRRAPVVGARRERLLDV